MRYVLLALALSLLVISCTKAPSTTPPPPQAPPTPPPPANVQTTPDTTLPLDNGTTPSDVDFNATDVSW